MCSLPAFAAVDNSTRARLRCHPRNSRPAHASTQANLRPLRRPTFRHRLIQTAAARSDADLHSAGTRTGPPDFPTLATRLDQSRRVAYEIRLIVVYLSRGVPRRSEERRVGKEWRSWWWP